MKDTPVVYISHKSSLNFSPEFEAKTKIHLGVNHWLFWRRKKPLCTICLKRVLVEIFFLLWWISGIPNWEYRNGALFQPKYEMCIGVILEMRKVGPEWIPWGRVLEPTKLNRVKTRSEFGSVGTVRDMCPEMSDIRVFACFSSYGSSRFTSWTKKFNHGVACTLVRRCITVF